MKRLCLMFLGLGFWALSFAQEAVDYYLPKTELRFRVLVERTEYAPGEFSAYSERFLKRAAQTEASVEYKIIGISMYQTAVPDSEKKFSIPVDKKHNIFKIEKESNGVLLAVNAKRKSYSTPEEFKAGRKAGVIDPHDYMSEEILTASSKTKMAELTAREIYDIRTSRNELNRGEAEYLPRDGEQLRIMLANLDKQENILLQCFNGITVRDTTETEFVYIPEGTNEDEELITKGVLFRFSNKAGLLENNNLSGSAYYVQIEDLETVPTLSIDESAKKKSKDATGITVNQPGKVKVSVINGSKTVASFEAYCAQYGKLEVIPDVLFGTKYATKLQLNPITGIVESFDYEPL